MPGTRLSTQKLSSAQKQQCSFSKCKMWAHLKCSPVMFTRNCYTELRNKVDYSVRKRNGTLTQATTWMDLESVMLSEVSHREGQILHNSASMRGLEYATRERQSRMETTPGQGTGELFSMYSFFSDDKKALSIGYGNTAMMAAEVYTYEWLK